MTQLFDQKRPQTLDAALWDPATAGAAIDGFVSDALRYYRRAKLWGIHPLDKSPERSATLKTLYYGGAGVIWTLTELGAEVPGVHDAIAAARTAARSEAEPLSTLGRNSFLMGDAGFALLELKLGRPPADLAAAVQSALDLPPSASCGAGQAACLPRATPRLLATGSHQICSPRVSAACWTRGSRTDSGKRACMDTRTR